MFTRSLFEHPALKDHKEFFIGFLDIVISLVYCYEGDIIHIFLRFYCRLIILKVTQFSGKMLLISQEHYSSTNFKI